MRRFHTLLFVLFLGWAAPALAAVDIHFQSKDFASTFPHAFVRLTGTVDSTGEQVDTNYGFTPISLSPGILMGPVKGMIQTVDPAYVARSDKHFTLTLTEPEYRTVLAIVEKWRNAPQPNYRLNGRNCVDFVAEVATALGLRAPVVPKLMKKPKSYLQMVTRENSLLIQQWPNRIAVAAGRAPPASSAASPPVPAQ